jgi:hypothetical protein
MIISILTHIMNVSILRIATQTLWFRRISKIKEKKSSAAGIGPWPSSNGNTIVELLVYHYIVSASSRKISEVTSQVNSIVKSNRMSWVNGKELCLLECYKNYAFTTYLFHVKDLNAMARQLATDKHVVLVATDLVPDRVVPGGRVWGTGWALAKVYVYMKLHLQKPKFNQLSSLVNLKHCNTFVCSSSYGNQIQCRQACLMDKTHQQTHDQIRDQSNPKLSYLLRWEPQGPHERWKNTIPSNKSSQSRDSNECGKTPQTSLHLNLCRGSPGIASAKPLIHFVYPS